MAKIICVVDNEALIDSNLNSEHGLSFWIETEDGNILFDSGQTAAALAHNLARLGLSPGDIDGLVLSHAHSDHTGGLEVVLSKNTRLTLFAHADVFRPRYALRKGAYESIGLALEQADLARRVQVKLSDTPLEILPNLWTTGDIYERLEPEGSGAHLFIRGGDGWQPDPYRDDLSLVLKTPAGLVLICGCCHAGILNVLYHVERTFSAPIIAVIGGTHLVSADDPALEHVIQVLNERFPNLTFYLNHCTGKPAFKKLVDSFGSRVNPCPAGTVVNF
ncbi:MAG: MBL fold metallo-hydrolase [Anaerolineaceae bacterium]|nr:MBL fold metallo-hydrolase [Anaerolineaceae bacterium]